MTAGRGLFLRRKRPTGLSELASSRSWAQSGSQENHHQHRHPTIQLPSITSIELPVADNSTFFRSLYPSPLAIVVPIRAKGPKGPRQPWPQEGHRHQPSYHPTTQERQSRQPNSKDVSSPLPRSTGFIGCRGQGLTICLCCYVCVHRWCAGLGRNI
jgi:hypothetical protein